MKVFISWSGPSSKAIATELRRWLKRTLDAAVFMSADDIGFGEPWLRRLQGELRNTRFCIVVLTPENLSAPWLNFEAGAISKEASNNRVCPLLCGVKAPEGPLEAFQAKTLDRCWRASGSADIR